MQPTVTISSPPPNLVIAYFWAALRNKRDGHRPDRPWGWVSSTLAAGLRHAPAHAVAG